MNKGNQNDNRCRQYNLYCTGDNVLLKTAKKTKLNQNIYVGPYTMANI